MLGWEAAITRFLAAVRLDRIKGKILVFSILATLLPALSMGWLSYRNNSRALTAKVGQELTSLTSHASRALDLWLRERRYDVRVFSTSYEVSENLVEVARSPEGSSSRERSLRRLADYLRFVGQRFVDYRELQVIGPDGTVIATSAAPPDGSGTKVDWIARVESQEPILGEPYWDARSGTAAMVVAQPVQTEDDRRLGFVAAKIDLRSIDVLLKEIVPEPDRIELYVIDPRGTVLASSRAVGGAPGLARLPAQTAVQLFTESGTMRFKSFRGVDVVGSLRPVETLNWGVVAETEQALAYAPIRKLRNTTLLMLSMILLGVGSAAYVLGMTIVRPLHRLTSGAAAVAAGDLSVDLPAVGGEELVSLTRTFNGMVAGLRRAREDLAATNLELREKNRELHELSITDGLTHVFNRSYLTRILANELDRCRRHAHPFAVLMIDIDRFKNYNDTHGHLAGDGVLVGVAAVLRESVRSCDYVARYGGEEFLVLLPETDLEEAEKTAERIREMVERRFSGDEGLSPITISVGVACFPDCGQEVDDVVRAADVALYQAKRSGRNRVVVDTGAGRREASA